MVFEALDDHTEKGSMPYLRKHWRPQLYNPAVDAKGRAWCRSCTLTGFSHNLHKHSKYTTNWDQATSLGTGKCTLPNGTPMKPSAIGENPIAICCSREPKSSGSDSQSNPRCRREMLTIKPREEPDARPSPLLEPVENGVEKIRSEEGRREVPEKP